MLINDKRGRLVRAYPTYYMVMIDEGRKIGSWKLHDNFYSMSAISELQVVKSRKIAADTCRMVMSNMYTSYATEYDSATTQQYADVYGLRDAFDSIFSPATYFQKEEALRLRKTIPDKVVLEPGVRIHVRMGYTADGSKLPIVFNGKIAEVGADSVVEVIAQGDGHELMNPLNAFGALEVTALEHAQKNITIGKDIRGKFAKGGETPRNLLTQILTAKHGGLVKNTLNEWFDGRWFNDNPFGIMHFGDYRMKNIFADGEVVQNLYEVADSTLLNGVNEIYSEKNGKDVAPTLNTSLQDKTFWDLLHMSANSGIEYYGGIRDFGMRSTIFLGKANHYYAYAYSKIDDKIVEKRKPFQQFHYYDSFTDIIYNSVKASEATVKTNAVGVWQSSSPLWGRDQSTVGPIYLDMNIYPEYQKSMTVDTGLLASGNGGFDFNPFKHLGEKLSSNANDDKVNKELAWRITMNVLRQNVKDMYDGEICVIGDPSVRPYDRIFVKDTYEDMTGQMEVETVIFNMSGETGFTTTIIPDVIVRHNDPHELARQQLTANFATVLTTVVTSRLMLINHFARVDSKLITAIAKSNKMYGLTKHASKTAANLAEATGLAKYVKDSDSALGELLNKTGLSLTGITFDEVALTKFNLLIKELDSLSLNKLLDLAEPDDIKTMAKALRNLGGLDEKTYTEVVKKLYTENARRAGKSVEEVDEVLEEITKSFEDLTEKKNRNISKVDMKRFVEIIEASDEFKNDKIKYETKEILKRLSQTKNIDSLTDMGELLEDKNIISIVSKNDEAQDVLKWYTTFTNQLFISTDELPTPFFNRKYKLATKTDDLTKGLANVFKYGLKFNLATLGIEIAKTAALWVITSNTKEFITRWVKSIQALTVYPVNKNGRLLLAGMNGHKGSVAGFPPKDGWDSIQGMLMKTKDTFIKPLGLIGDILFDDLIMDSEAYNEVTAKWKDSLGITEEDETDIHKEQRLQEIYTHTSNELGARAQTFFALKTRVRIQKFDTANKTDATYLKYAITGVKADEINTNSKIKALYPIEEDPDVKRAILKTHPNNVQFDVVHKLSDAEVQIPFESGTRNIRYTVSNGVFDMPLVQEECVYIINKILNKQEVNGAVISFKSGVLVNDKRTWKNTGFSFILESNKPKALKKAVESVREDCKWNQKDKTQQMFDYQEKNNMINITVYAPLSTTEGRAK
jgi:hypothetical protein